MAAQKRIPDSTVLRILSPHGFWLAYSESQTFDGYERPACFSRRSVVHGCFEQVEVDYFGDSVETSAFLAVVPGGAGWREMFERVRVEECCFKLRTAEDRLLWRKLLVAGVPKVTGELSLRRGAELLKRTGRARAAAGFYLSLFPGDVTDLVAFSRQLKASASAKQREQARSSLRPALLSLPFRSSEEEDRGFSAYQIASYLITLNEKMAIDRGFFAAGIDPHFDRDLAFCFQIMATWIFGEPGREFIKFD